MRDQERSQKSGSSSNRFTPAEKARDTIGQRRSGRKGGEIKHLAPPPPEMELSAIVLIVAEN